MSWIRVEPTYEDPSDSEAGDSTALGDVHHVHGYNVIITTSSRPLYLNYLFAREFYFVHVTMFGQLGDVIRINILNYRAILHFTFTN